MRKTLLLGRMNPTFFNAGTQQMLNQGGENKVSNRQKNFSSPYLLTIDKAIQRTNKESPTEMLESLRNKDPEDIDGATLLCNM